MELDSRLSRSRRCRSSRSRRCRSSRCFGGGRVCSSGDDLGRHLQVGSAGRRHLDVLLANASDVRRLDWHSLQAVNLQTTNKPPLSPYYIQIFKIFVRCFTWVQCTPHIKFVIFMAIWSLLQTPTMTGLRNMAACGTDPSEVLTELFAPSTVTTVAIIG